MYRKSNSGKSTSKRWLELELKDHFQLKQRKKSVGEASYGEVTRKGTVNKGKIYYADLSLFLLH